MPGRSCFGGGWGHLAGDHDFRGLDDGQRLVAAPELQFVDRIPGDNGGQRLIAYPQPNLGEQPLAPHFVDDAVKLVAAAESDNRPV
jgi:hypothetical protein